jgi:hypothetical protein
VVWSPDDFEMEVLEGLSLDEEEPAPWQATPDHAHEHHLFGQAGPGDEDMVVLGPDDMGRQGCSGLWAVDDMEPFEDLMEDSHVLVPGFDANGESNLSASSSFGSDSTAGSHFSHGQHSPATAGRPGVGGASIWALC